MLGPFILKDKMILRPYQEKSLTQTRQAYANGKRKILIWLATGGGKSVLFGKLISNLKNNNKSVLLTMRSRDLIFQAYKNLKKWEMDASIIMGDEPGYDPNNKIQICSIDTIHKRIDNLPHLREFDFNLWEEAHELVSDTYGTFISKLSPSACSVGYTASPFYVGNKGHTYWDICLNSIMPHELRDQGYLADVDVYAPSKINTDKIPVVGGEFEQCELFKCVTRLEVIGNTVEMYKKYGYNKPALLFAVNIEHSKIMCRAFNQAGIPAVHIDGTSSKEERDRACEDSKKSIIKVICNVLVFGKGKDLPWMEIGLMVRPTWSEILYVQMVGRLSRPFKICTCGREFGAEQVCHAIAYEKPGFIILDHANNSERHGLPYKIRQAQMTDRKKGSKKEKGLLQTKTCLNCFAVVETKHDVCPYCNVRFPVVKNIVRHKKGTLELIKCGELAITEKITKQVVRYYEHITEQAEEKGYKDFWKYHRIYSKYGLPGIEAIDAPEWVVGNFRSKGV